MKILFSLVLLALISCGGGTGGSGVIGNPAGNYGGGQVFDTLEKFKSAVAANNWGQDPFFKNYNTYKFNYRNPRDSTGCRTIAGIISICLDTGSNQGILTVTESKTGITGAFVEYNHIKEVVRNATAQNTNYTYYYDVKGQIQFTWIIVSGNETFAFNTALPLGGNPTYYKNTNPAMEYSLVNFNFNP